MQCWRSDHEQCHVMTCITRFLIQARHQEEQFDPLDLQASFITCWEYDKMVHKHPIATLHSYNQGCRQKKSFSTWILYVLKTGTWDVEDFVEAPVHLRWRRHHTVDFTCQNQLEYLSSYLTRCYGRKIDWLRPLKKKEKKRKKKRKKKTKKRDFEIFKFKNRIDIAIPG